MSEIYKLQLTERLYVWAGVLRHVLSYGSEPLKGTMHPDHAISNTPWDFTGRYRFTSNWMQITMLEVEVVYEEWVQVSRGAQDRWDKFWNGTYTYEKQPKTMWVGEEHFEFVEKKPVYTYECGCSCPEVTYE